MRLARPQGVRAAVTGSRLQGVRAAATASRLSGSEGTMVNGLCGTGAGAAVLLRFKSAARLAVVAPRSGMHFAPRRNVYPAVTSTVFPTDRGRQNL